MTEPKEHHNNSIYFEWLISSSLSSSFSSSSFNFSILIHFIWLYHENTSIFLMSRCFYSHSNSRGIAQLDIDQQGLIMIHYPRHSLPISHGLSSLKCNKSHISSHFWGLISLNRYCCDNLNYLFNPLLSDRIYCIL